MEINPTPEQRDFIRRAVAEGRLKRAEDAARDGLDLWVERERRRDELLAAIDAADAEAASGEGTVITSESMRALADDVKRRGRERLAAARKHRAG